jgi:CheY-like chemotaxis protein
VLAVAHHPSARRALREQLIGWGMSCDEAADTAAALLAARAKAPALVVIDDDVPGGGQAAATALRTEPALAAVPQVLLATMAHRGMAAAASQAGCAGFLTKPLRQAQLFDCLLVVFNRSCHTAPRASMAAPALVTRHTLAEDHDLRRVLVVEDNPVNRQVAVGMLAKLGCRCDMATNGQEAVEALARQDYQLVFMDCQMPVMDGFAATAEIRRREGERRHTPIIALTANAMAGDRERCLAAGMDDYVSKPITQGDLAQAIGRFEDQRPGRAMPVAIPPVTAEGPALDLTALQALVDSTDLATLRAVVGMFNLELPQVLAELKTAKRSLDPVAIARTSHRLKGSTGTLGLVRVHHLCQRLDQHARRNEVDHFVPLIDAIAAALVQDLALLAAHPLVTGRG